ncbi:MAG: ATP-dependent helicase/nuclease subunit A, partial [Myxococcota bacterium]
MSTPIDQDARTRAWQTFDQSVDVTAGAGTGKTRVLVDRYLAWVLARGWAWPERATATSVVGSILAITFTEKAAGEMQERIGRSLRAMLGEPVASLSDFESDYVKRLAESFQEFFGISAETLAVRAKAVLEQSHRMEVSTIHAFASRVLRSWPLEAGVHPGFEVDVEGVLRRKLVRKAFVDATHAGLLGDEGPRWARAVSTFGEDRLLDLICAWLDTGSAGNLPAPPDLHAARTDCLALDRSLGQIAHLVKGGSAKKMERVRRGLKTAARALELPTLATDPRGTLVGEQREAVDGLNKDLKGFPPATMARLLPDSAGFAAAVERVRDTLTETLEADPAAFAEVAELYGPVLEAAQQAVLSEGLLSFDDLLGLTERVLTTQDGVAASLAERYGQLLVDEFQDTNPQQCRILDAVAKQDDRARLFVVGDPKQSIYAFRQADLAAYESFCATLDLRLILRANFRSQKTLVEALNRGFDTLFIAEPGVQPGPQALEPTRDPRDEVAVHVWDAGPAAKGQKRNAEEAREVEASAICRAILARVRAEAEAAGVQSTSPGWSRFAVLSRVQSEAAVTVRILEEAGIPCVVTGDKEFYRRQEVLDVVNLLRVILDPADALAWIGLLRCPLGAVPDRCLIDLAQAGFFAGDGQRDAVRAAEALAPDRARDLRRVGVLVQTLEGLRVGLLDGPIDLWLEELLTRLPIPDLHATQYLGERKAANVLRVLESFCEAAVLGAVPLREWLEDVAQRLVGRQDESESALADETTDAVRVMSIHASKGLQFAHVFVPRLDWRKGGGANDEISLQQTPAGWVIRGAGRSTWGGAAARRAAATTEQAETLRLLYVACTRAEETLSLVGRRVKAPMATMVEAGFLTQAAWSPAVVRAFAEQVHADIDVTPAEPESPASEAGLVRAAIGQRRRAEARWERARGRKLVQAASSAELALDDDLDEDTEAQPEPGAADGAA